MSMSKGHSHRIPLREDGKPYEVGDTLPVDDDGNCLLCNGTGWYTFDINHDWYTKPCPCGMLDEVRHHDRLKFASIPDRYKEIRLKDLKASVYVSQDNQKAFVRCCGIIKRWLDDYDRMSFQGKGLYLFSETKGSGKTMTAAGIANELVSKGVRVKFATSVDIYNEIKRTFDSNRSSSEYTESQLLDALATSPVLIIDDFGTERSTDWQNEEMFAIVNRRYVNKKITIFTSNCDPTNARTDRRITSRIEEMCFVVPFPNEDVREHIQTDSMNSLMKGDLQA